MTAPKIPAPPGATARRAPKGAEARVVASLRKKLAESEARFKHAHKALHQARFAGDSAAATRDALSEQLTAAHAALNRLGIDATDGKGTLRSVPDRIERLSCRVLAADHDRALCVRAEQDARRLNAELNEAHEVLNAMGLEAEDVNGHPMTLPRRLSPIRALVIEKEAAADRAIAQAHACHDVLDDAGCSRDDRAGGELSLAARVELALLGAGLALAKLEVARLAAKVTP